MYFCFRFVHWFKNNLTLKWNEIETIYKIQVFLLGSLMVTALVSR